MKKTSNYIIIIFVTIFCTCFFPLSKIKAQKTVTYNISNKGSKTVSFSQRNNKNNNVGAVIYKLDAGKKQSNEGQIGNKIVVECNEKKQIFYLKETKDNDFVVDCN